LTKAKVVGFGWTFSRRPCEYALTFLFNPQNAEKVALFPTLGPPWGPERAEKIVSELETMLGSKQFICGETFRFVPHHCFKIFG
jgi:hypothetical protein